MWNKKRMFKTCCQQDLNACTYVLRAFMWVGKFSDALFADEANWWCIYKQGTDLLILLVMNARWTGTSKN